MKASSLMIMFAAFAMAAVSGNEESPHRTPKKRRTVDDIINDGPPPMKRRQTPLGRIPLAPKPAPKTPTKP